MKSNIHPNYVECVVTCGCGETFKTRSTKPKIAVEICSKCHPFYTGKQKFVDTAGRVEKFTQRFGNVESFIKKAEAEAQAKRSRAAEEAAAAAAVAAADKKRKKAEKAAAAKVAETTAGAESGAEPRPEPSAS